MDIVSINGVPIPSNIEVGYEINDITKASRNSKGTMMIEKIATKYKISLKFKHISKSDLKDFLANMKTIPFNVTFVDPVTDELRTSSFYPGGRTFSVLNVYNNEIIYKDMSVNIIER